MHLVPPLCIGMHSHPTLLFIPYHLYVSMCVSDFGFLLTIRIYDHEVMMIVICNCHFLVVVIVSGVISCVIPYATYSSFI